LAKDILHANTENESEWDTINQFLSLAKAHILEKYGDNRWKVHDLVRNVCVKTLDANILNSTNRSLGLHFNRISGGWKNRKLNDQTFQLKIRAIHHLSLVPHEIEKTERLLNLISTVVKRRGHYRQFVHLCEDLIKNRRVEDPWVMYHYAHCCFIAGARGEAYRVAEELCSRRPEGPATLELAAHRLYAEVLLANKDFDAASSVLRTALANAPAGIQKDAHSHARSILVRIDTELKNFGSARDNARILLQEAQRDDRMIGAAVALMRLGIIDLLEGKAAVATDQFRQARQIFDETGDKRGEAWSIVYLARAALNTKDYNQVLDLSKMACQIYESIETQHDDYRSLLSDILQKDVTDQLRNFATKELKTSRSEAGYL
jgi:tetratricopeptide (TPR) repeat protein